MLGRLYTRRRLRLCTETVWLTAETKESSESVGDA
jgi:hypothetical protein